MTTTLPKVLAALEKLNLTESIKGEIMVTLQSDTNGLTQAAAVAAPQSPPGKQRGLETRKDITQAYEPCNAVENIKQRTLKQMHTLPSFVYYNPRATEKLDMSSNLQIRVI